MGLDVPDGQLEQPDKCPTWEAGNGRFAASIKQALENIDDLDVTLLTSQLLRG